MFGISHLEHARYMEKFNPDDTILFFMREAKLKEKLQLILQELSYGSTDTYN